jgi:hypothetical protein
MTGWVARKSIIPATRRILVRAEPCDIAVKPLELLVHIVQAVCVAARRAVMERNCPGDGLDERRYNWPSTPRNSPPVYQKIV